MLFFGRFQEKLLCSHWKRNCVTGSVTLFVSSFCFAIEAKSIFVQGNLMSVTRKNKFYSVTLSLIF